MKKYLEFKNESIDGKDVDIQFIKDCLLDLFEMCKHEIILHFYINDKRYKEFYMRVDDINNIDKYKEYIMSQNNTNMVFIYGVESTFFIKIPLNDISKSGLLFNTCSSIMEEIEVAIKRLSDYKIAYQAYSGHSNPITDINQSKTEIEFKFNLRIFDKDIINVLTGFRNSKWIN